MRGNKKRFFLMIALVGAIILLLASCAGESTTTPIPTRGTESTTPASAGCDIRLSADDVQDVIDATDGTKTCKGDIAAAQGQIDGIANAGGAKFCRVFMTGGTTYPMSVGDIAVIDWGTPQIAKDLGFTPLCPACTCGGWGIWKSNGTDFSNPTQGGAIYRIER
jgi:hypothetical protein